MNAVALTPVQRDCLDAIRALSKNGVAPSLDELRRHLGLASKSNVHRLIQLLMDRGLIQHTFGQPRSLRIVGEPLLGVDLASLSTEDLMQIKHRVDGILCERAS